MKVKKILLLILSIVLGGVFIFSAVSKTQPISYFEYIIESQAHLSHAFSAILARFFIGLEAALGLLLLTTIYGWRRWSIKAAIALLFIFSIYLMYLLISHGNDVNCGCMGNVVPMSPAVSLLKNAGLLIGLFVLLRWHKTHDGLILDLSSFLLTVIIIAVSFFLFPISRQIALPLSKLYNTTISQHPSAELRKGKHILCFMSLTCPHCMHAATKIAKMVKNDPTLPFYFAFAGGADSTREQHFKDFVEETKIKDIPYHFMNTKEFVDMINLSGNSGVPVILWMQDTVIVRQVNMDELNQKDLEAWLTQ